jgi:hypothetical protein
MMCNSVSLSVATWKSVTEKPSSSEPQENEGAEESDPESEPDSEPEPEPESEPESEPASEAEELPLETVPEIHFWVYRIVSMCTSNESTQLTPRLPRLEPKPLPHVKPEKEKPP